MLYFYIYRFLRYHYTCYQTLYIYKYLELSKDCNINITHYNKNQKKRIFSREGIGFLMTDGYICFLTKSQCQLIFGFVIAKYAAITFFFFFADGRELSTFRWTFCCSCQIHVSILQFIPKETMSKIGRTSKNASHKTSLKFVTVYMSIDA